MLNAGLDGTVHRIRKINGQVYAAGAFKSGSGVDLPGVAVWENGRWHRPWISKLKGQVRNNSLKTKHHLIGLSHEIVSTPLYPF